MKNKDCLALCAMRYAQSAKRKAHNAKRTAHSAFTLIELLIATAIFSVVALGIYSAFYTASLTYRRIDRDFGLYQASRITLNRIEQDLKNSFGYVDDDSKFKGGSEELDFFAIRDSYQKNKKITDVCRIKYSLADNILKRYLYKGLDALKDDVEITAQDLADNVEEVSFKYAYQTEDSNNPYDWQEAWPFGSTSPQLGTLPIAVKIKLVMFQKEKKNNEKKLIEFIKVVTLPLSQITKTVQSSSAAPAAGASGTLPGP